MKIQEIQQNGDYLNIILDDSRRVSVDVIKTPAARELKEGQDISEGWTVKEWDNPKGGVKLFLNEKKKGFPKRDYGMEKRIAALNAASRFKFSDPLDMHSKPSDMTLQLANKYLKWLNG